MATWCNYTMIFHTLSTTVISAPLEINILMISGQLLQAAKCNAVLPPCSNKQRSSIHTIHAILGIYYKYSESAIQDWFHLVCLCNKFSTLFTNFNKHLMSSLMLSLLLSIIYLNYTSDIIIQYSYFNSYSFLQFKSNNSNDHKRCVFLFEHIGCVHFLVNV